MASEVLKGGFEKNSNLCTRTRIYLQGRVFFHPFLFFFLILADGLNSGHVIADLFVGLNYDSIRSHETPTESLVFFRLAESKGVVKGVQVKMKSAGWELDPGFSTPIFFLRPPKINDINGWNLEMMGTQ